MGAVRSSEALQMCAKRLRSSRQARRKSLRRGFRDERSSEELFELVVKLWQAKAAHGETTMFPLAASVRPALQWKRRRWRTQDTSSTSRFRAKISIAETVAASQCRLDVWSSAPVRPLGVLLPGAGPSLNAEKALRASGRAHNATDVKSACSRSRQRSMPGSFNSPRPRFASVFGRNYRIGLVPREAAGARRQTGDERRRVEFRETKS